MSKFEFGDKLIYTSPQKSDLKTPCVFLRDDNGKAVVMFSHAEWAARVNYLCLSKENGSHMEQRTCNIIMCCKGHCNLDGADNTLMGDIAAYMSHECGCPKEDYTGRLMESILREAMFDYIASADKPGFELRQLFQQYAVRDPSLLERICIMFQLTQVCDSNGYVNGFTEELIKQSEKDLGGEVTAG